jgi:glutathione S-transferase
MNAESTLVLYQYSGDSELPSISPPCTKVLLALRLLDAPHTVVVVSGPGDVKRVSATGRLPALDIGGQFVTDSVQILDRLEEHLGRSLSPSAPDARARDRAWEYFAGDSLYWLGLYTRWLVAPNRERMLRALFPGALKRLVFGAVLHRRIRARSLAQGIGYRSEAEVREEFARMLEVLVHALGDDAFLSGGEVPGRGDLAVASFLIQVGWRGVTAQSLEALNACPSLVAHLRRTLVACGTAVPSWVSAT